MGTYDERARERIRTWRLAQGLTQAELGRRIDRNAVWVSRYLDGAYDADLDTLAKIAAALGHSLYELLDVRDDPTEQKLIDVYRALPVAHRTLALNTLRAMIPAPRKGRR